MQTVVSRSLPIKGSGAKRISRWHPYSVSISTPSSSSSSNESVSPHGHISKKKCTISSSVYIHTPVSMLSSTSSDDRSSFGISSGQISSISAPLERDQSTFLGSAASATHYDREQHASDLVEQALSLLSQSWQKVAFCAYPGPANVVTKTASVVSPVTAAASYLPSPRQSPPASLTAHEAPLPGQYPYQSTAEHMPLRQFVHEVVRRSRTACTTLQTALCYVEAVTQKLPELISEELERIDKLNASIFLKDDAVVDEGAFAPPHEFTASEVDTVDVVSPDSNKSSEPATQASAATPESTSSKPTKNRHQPGPALAPLPPLPSPLLCPRRTFLAAMLLASKFLQDRSYSNKAWAKLTGLAPREIGRCERALLQALEWRLWVGKGQNDPIFRSDSMDDGGLAIAFDRPYGTVKSTAGSSVSPNQPIGFPASPAVSDRVSTSPPIHVRERRISKCKSDSALITQLKRKMALAALSGTDSPLATKSWASTSNDSLASTLPRPPLPLGRKETNVARLSPIAAIAQPSRNSTFVETGYLSTPSLLDTQSSFASTSSFSEIFTPPVPFVTSQLEMSAFGQKADCIGTMNSDYLDVSMHDIVGRG